MVRFFARHGGFIVPPRRPSLRRSLRAIEQALAEIAESGGSCASRCPGKGRGSTR